LLGESVLVVALISPLDQLGGTLLSAHMAQHGLLVAAAPPLLLLGKPGVAFAWALPTGWNRISVLAGATRLTALLSRPLVAAVLHGLAVWIWHAPNLFDAAVEREWLHALEHASFFGTALLLWRAVLVQPRRQAGPALGAALATLLHSGLLGALLTMAPYPLYSWYRDGRTELWGLSALGDQQLAGLLMWVPLGVFYFAACLVLTARLIGSEQLQHRST
jgi:putative membrane protein